MDNMSRRGAIKLAAATGAVAIGAGAAAGQEQVSKQTAREGSPRSYSQSRLDSIRKDKAVMEELSRRSKTGDISFPYETRLSQGSRNVSESVQKFIDSPESPNDMGSEESIVLQFGRPVLFVQRSSIAANPTFTDPQSEVWKDRLNQARPRILAAIPAVGRIEVKHHFSHDWIGTGWLVAPNVIVTNRHVAREFGERRGADFAFRRGTQGLDMTASIDYREEYGINDELSFAVDKILHIEDSSGPDMAFLRIVTGGNGSGSSIKPISLASGNPPLGRQVVVIGYPAYDSRIPDTQIMERIYQGIYNVKRLAPGLTMTPQDGLLRHDCTTLGGNSGSCVIDLETGQAVGLHFSGRYKEANYAVPAKAIADRMSALGV